MFSKIIVDANILISAYGIDGEVRKYWRDSLGVYKIVVSPEVVIEVESRLRNGEFSMSSDEIKTILKDIIERCEIVRPAPARDKFQNFKDAHLAALAMHRYADGVPPGFLLTSDEALRREGSIGACKVVDIAEFCNSTDHLRKP